MKLISAIFISALMLIMPKTWEPETAPLIIRKFITQNVVAPQTIKTIPKNADGGWYYPDVSHINPGDTILVTGDYAYAYVKGLNGTTANKITIRTGTNSVFGTNGSYALILENCSNIIIDGRNDLAEPYALKFGKASGTYSAQSLTVFNATNVEIGYVEVRRAEVGIFGNPKTGVQDSLYFHHNYIHDLRGAGSSEAFYIGWTGQGTIAGVHSTNVRIIQNRVDDVGGDGIQLANSQGFVIQANTVTNFGLQNLGVHRTGITVGGNSWGTVSDNIIKNGTGSGIQVFGCSTNVVNYNIIENTGNSLSEQPDAVYISKRGGTDCPALQVNMEGNIITGALRYGINNDGTGTTGGLWNCNVVTATVNLAFRTNGDVVTNTSCSTPPASCNCFPSNKIYIN